MEPNWEILLYVFCILLMTLFLIIVTWAFLKTTRDKKANDSANNFTINNGKKDNQ